MALIIPFEGREPEIDPSAFVAPNATLIGKVRIAAGASVFYGAVLRGDMDEIVLGEGSNLQDNCVVHTDLGVPTTIGAGVGIGHGAIVHGTTIEDGSLIGMGAVLLNRSVIGAGSLVAAGAVVLEGQEIPPNSIVAGVPAKVRGPIEDEGMRDRVRRNAIEYRELAQRHRGLHPVPPRGERTVTDPSTPAAGGPPLSSHETDAAGYAATRPLGLLTVHRGELIAVAVIGLILGIVGFLFPGATSLTVAIVFGAYLVASGIFRITAAFIADRLSTGQRWLTGVVGLIVVILGVICLANPFRSLVVLAFVIGFGWIAEGIVDFMAGLRSVVRPRWLAFVSAVLSIAAGISMFWLPIAGVQVLVTVGSILLIIVCLTTLLTLPRKSSE